MTEVTTLYADQLEHIAKLTWIDRWPLNRKMRKRVNLCRKNYLEKCYPELFDITMNDIFDIREMNYEAMVFFSTLPESKRYINNITSEAAFNGDQILLDRMLALGANEYQNIAIVAAYGGHFSIVNQMIKLGANDYNELATAAAFYGHLNIVIQLVELGANDYNYIAYHAAAEGHLNIVIQLIKLGANNYNRIAYYAAIEQHSSIVELMRILEAGTL